MTDNNIKPVRVMHLVSSEGVTGAAQQALFMPMLTRMPKARVKMLVVALSPDVVQGPVLRQNGVPVYDVALSKRRFSIAAFGQLVKTARAFRPDVIQAWGHTAQIVAQWLRTRCDSDADVKVVWSVASTTPIARKPGMIDRKKLSYAAKLSKHADRIVYTSEAAASTHRRVGFPEDGHLVVPLGVDPTRFKPDPAMRRKVRERLGLDPNAFVIGMMAPFQPEYDHTTLVKAVGELIKTNPNVSLLLAGHGVQKGNGPLMALVGGGTLGTRTQLLGEWSDVAAFFNACDLACSSALTDNGRMSLVMAMLCGIPCVATGMGAQGEVIGQHGVAVEPGSPTALIRGITRVMQMPNDRRMHMAQGARKHALATFVSIRSLQKYLQLYYDLVGRKLEAAASVPAPKIDAAIPAPASVEQEPPQPVAKAKTNRSVDMNDLADPDSLESRESPAASAPTPKPGEGDVLQMFESTLATQTTTHRSPMNERARGVTEEFEDLLTPEELQGGGAAKSSPAPAAVSPIEVMKVAPAAVATVEAPKPAPAIAPSVEPVKSAPAVAMKAEAVELASEAATNVEPVSAAPSSSTTPAKIIASVAPETSKADSSDELAFAETTLNLEAKLKLEATSTLEIPADLIFVPATSATPASPITPTPPAQPQAVAEPAPVAISLEATQPIVANAAEPSPPLSLVADGEVTSTPIATSQVDLTATNKVADSSTVPALAVDALLSATEGTASTRDANAEATQLDLLGDAPSTLQLDLLGEPPSDLKLVAG